jgi:signal transduction histidine kinase/PAS domain-containing protein
LETPQQEYRLLKICLWLNILFSAIFLAVAWMFITPSRYLPFYSILLGSVAYSIFFLRQVKPPTNRRYSLAFVLAIVSFNTAAVLMHTPRYFFMVFLLVFTFSIIFNIILVSWPEVLITGGLILGIDLSLMIWPHGLFQQSVAMIGLDLRYAVISIALGHMTFLILGTWIVEIKRRTEKQLRFINENLNKLVAEKVNEIRRADRQTRRAEEQLEKILRYTPVGVVIFNEELNCLYSNGVHFKFENREGKFQELPGNLLSLEMLQKILAEAMEHTGESGGHLVGERLDFVDAQQCERMVRYSFIPVTLVETDGAPPFKRLILIIEDITAEEILRYKLIQADHLAAMGKMAAGLAHEINNPLSVIRIYVEALGQGVTDPARKEKIHLVLKENIMRIDRIIKSFLTFGRQEKPTREWVDVLDVLKNTLDLATNLRQFDEIKICTEFSDGVPPIMGDQHRLSQVFVNLFNNARDAMQKVGGTMTIQYLREGRDLVIRIKDTGKGIKPENLKHIFTPFFTTKEPGEGTGLGLSISYGIIQEHGGNLEAESREGVGTAFTIRLPIPEKENLT